MCREWRDFKYPSKNIKFTYGIEDTDCFEGKDVSAINLPPFSSASVPKVHFLYIVYFICFLANFDNIHLSDIYLFFITN